jgi:hypothetical protein
MDLARLLDVLRAACSTGRSATRSGNSPRSQPSLATPSTRVTQTELFKHYSDNDGFRKWLSDTIFRLTFRPPAVAGA